jgi:hypothetical protein
MFFGSIQRYTTLQRFNRLESFDIVIAYSVAAGRLRERTEVRVPHQYIQDGRAGCAARELLLLCFLQPLFIILRFRYVIKIPEVFILL